METEKSSLVEEIYYDDVSLELTLKFRSYYAPYLTHINVPIERFHDFNEVKSIGRFYLECIKNKYKLKTEIMADRPKTINQCSDKTRYIKLSIDVTKVINKWFFQGEKGTWFHMTLALKPNGELDQYGNLGMITQDVPTSITKKEKDLPKDKKTRGEILGNACEFAPKDFEGTPGSESGELVGENAADDLPF